MLINIKEDDEKRLYDTLRNIVCALRKQLPIKCIYLIPYYSDVHDDIVLELCVISSNESRLTVTEYKDVLLNSDRDFGNIHFKSKFFTDPYIDCSNSEFIMNDYARDIANAIILYDETGEYRNLQECVINNDFDGNYKYPNYVDVGLELSRIKD